MALIIKTFCVTGDEKQERRVVFNFEKDFKLNQSKITFSVQNIIIKY